MKKRSRIIILDHQDQRVEGFEEDRISELPDEILCHILSFLPSLHAVRTSVLSTRWNNLWISVPSLDFDQTDFPGLGGWRALKKFIDRMLSLRKLSHIDRFRLSCCSFGFEEKDFCLFEPLNLTTSRNDIFELEFCIAADHHLRKLEVIMSEKLFMYETNLVQKVVTKFSVVPGCFPSNVESLSDLMEFLYLNSTAIEEDMSIYGSFGKQHFVNYHYCMPNLKTLSISLTIQDNEEPSTISVNAPKLESLVIHGSARDLPNYDLQNVTSLVRAEIDLPFTACLSPRGRLLLSTISSVTYLSLSVPCDIVACSLPVFDNLKQLKLFHLSSLVWLTEFLRRSPNLECLVLDTSHPKRRNADYMQRLLNERYGFAPFNPPQTVPDCLSLRLKTISWNTFTEDKEEREAVKYLLKHGEVLSKFSISTYLYLTQNIAKKLHKEILTFEKCSETCEVEVIGWYIGSSCFLSYQS